MFLKYQVMMMQTNQFDYVIYTSSNNAYYTLRTYIEFLQIAFVIMLQLTQLDYSIFTHLITANIRVDFLEMYVAIHEVSSHVHVTYSI